MERTSTILALSIGFGFVALAAEAVQAAPKIIQIDKDGNVEERYLGNDDQRVLAGERASADIQGDGLPVIVRGPGRRSRAADEPVILIRPNVSYPYYRAPIVPTLERPTVRRPKIVRPRIVRAHSNAHRRYRSGDSTIIFNGGHGRYGDVTIGIRQNVTVRGRR
ncbi:hypothetical protein [Notoacmeibacter marinus]|uniref:hypothetical protein n=1 Tax=Notoacmeibacter marinus TaxID=1876515 RepID=UPI000DF1280E|nr:hypothetical protein [Notoacmeibacter marinus]